MNRPTAPFVVREGGDGEPDLVAEWRIVDAQWRQVFAKAGLSKAFRVSMRLDPENREVRTVDEAWAVEWVSGMPQMSLVAFGGCMGQFEVGPDDIRKSAADIDAVVSGLPKDASGRNRLIGRCCRTPPVVTPRCCHRSRPGPTR